MPYLVFGLRKKVIFVHGCFWHGHKCQRGDRTPKNNRSYWLRKNTRNKERDQKNLDDLKAQGWQTLEFWECEWIDCDQVKSRLQVFKDV